ncbi:hypothetical protein OR62_03320 [Clostridium tetani]|uniref:Uncharacterized protein n=1 Tax=Clostridium tetani TaxID=1513 RepID=A0ABY0EQ99_CLOTA|nr:OadG family transporter subunit [Clostridium tetani]KHO39894.1 hypothetical protein OR62_03320 [Clostridium tetani]RXI41777.1 hypothetical protein DP129_00705 [Clostridium tetani]RXI57093.1 hypothetical protein DP131_05865 [Clostridium tetani]RXI67179.1 hypothetical protein DQN76_11885 [Clostridium tetani]
MSISEAILVALFLMLIVFTVLILLSLFLKLQSSFFDYIEKNKLLDAETPTNNNFDNTIELSNTTSFDDVDEETFAIILTSISCSSNIPLKSIKIKSIKPLDL